VSSSGVLAAQDAGSGSDAFGGGVGLLENHALAGEFFEVWGAIKGALIHRNIGPAKVIGQDNDNVWRRVGGGAEKDRAKDQEADTDCSRSRGAFEINRVRHEVRWNERTKVLAQS